MSHLRSKNVLVTRPFGEDFAEMLLRRGARASCHPVIQILDPLHWDKVDRAISQISDFDWVVFASANGVDSFVSRLAHMSDRSRLDSCKIAAIGTQTANRLKQHGLPVSLIPERSDSAAMADSLIAQAPMQSLLVRGDRGSRILANRLSQAGIKFTEIVSYRSVNVRQSDPEIKQRLIRGQFDWVTVTSSAIAESAVALWASELHRTKLISISPTTSAKLRELGHSPAAEAQSFNMTGMIEAMEHWEAQQD